MLSLILLHFAGACCAPLLVRWLGSRAFLVLALVPAAAAGWAFAHYAEVADGGVLVQRWRWMDQLGVELAFRCDALALLMVLVVGAVGALVLVYCAGYFSWAEFGLGQFAGTLTAFAGAMLGLVLADDLIVLYVLWELTTVFSFLLIGHVPERRPNRLAALQSLMVTTFGGLAMLLGFLILGREAGTFSVSGLLERPPEASGSVVAALLLVLAGALSKSAVWPFTFWLPGAMAAPTPVSAYLHAAAMVKAGVYLVGRFAPAYADAVPWRVTVLVLGASTMLLGGWRALRETDLKRLLAYGTVSQLGLLMLLFGRGTRDAALAGAALLLAHALFKAPLFLVVGIIDHATGTRHLNQLSGLGRSMPGVCAVAVLAGASMAGIPPLIGFAAKEAAFTSLLEGGGTALWLSGAVAAGSALTAAYTLRFLWGAFATKPAPALPGAEEEAGVAKQAAPIATPLRGTSGPFLLLPPALCSLAGLVLGPGVSLLDRLLSLYADELPADGGKFTLSLWHGFGAALWLSLLTWAVGALLFLTMSPLGRFAERMAVVEGAQVFARSLWSLERGSLEITGAVQRGSLPIYLGTALAFLITAQSTAMIVDPPWRHVGTIRWYDSVPQLGVVLIICVVAVLCLISRHRMKAVVLAGVTGYGTAVLYVLHGAPDVALTQFAVETVSLVVFVLVLRRLPARFPSQRRTSTPRRVTQVVTGLAAGGFAAVLTYVAGAARVDPPAGPGLTVATAEHGLKNIVPNTLVDLRSWDTLGESAVLAVAVVGVTSLVYLRRRPGSAVPGETAAAAGQPPGGPGRPAAGPPAPRGGGESGRRRAGSVLGPEGVAYPSAVGALPRRTWLTASGTLDPERRSVIFEVVARLVFHPIVVLSLYLLFCAENLPGGGFTAGLVAGLALAVRYLAGGRHELAAAAPVDAGFLLGLGLLTMTLTGLVGLIAKGSVLKSAVYHGSLPVIGDYHAASPVLFDAGVYLLVLGVVLDVLRSLGSGIDRRVERDLRNESRGGPRTGGGEAAGGGEGGTRPPGEGGA
ncbi:Na+/H+ antiporter subunit A [Streptomyces daqingensis]|uniref:Na+/H+ antiporter subunit A n=1 Tax=Streptomyces daqingensis TaxID=1472640 RepID=A0ABQ2LUY0_9ACTN|nr:Na+/H+ antiporter subunit A [Streptomyces daqingensis]GGO42528.1 Na+/H+ antiporter subunit A [Streptomyces daqingensis]